jgi:hypothetical protein
MKKKESQAPAINEQMNQRADAASVRSTSRTAALLGCAICLTDGEKYAVV